MIQNPHEQDYPLEWDEMVDALLFFKCHQCDHVFHREGMYAPQDGRYVEKGHYDTLDDSDMCPRCKGFTKFLRAVDEEGRPL
jgi:rubredoxin